MKPSSDSGRAATVYARSFRRGKCASVPGGPEFMKTLVPIAAGLLLGVARMLGQSAPPPTSPGAAAQSPAQSPPASTSSPSSQEVPGAAPLRVMVGKSLLINTTERLKRVSVTDPTVADALPVTPTQV